MQFETDEIRENNYATEEPAASGNSTDHSSHSKKDDVLGTVPSQIGPYTVERFLGSGSRSEVYAVRDDHSNWFALKTVSAQNTQLRERVFREFQARDAISDFSHIAKAYQPHQYDVGDTAVVAYPMELFHGNLRFLIPRLMKLNPTDRVNEVITTWMPQILSGVDTCHAAGVLHLDLKPGNILYDPDRSRLVVSDFGISSVETNPPSSSGPSPTSGTAAYMAPEQVLGETPDERTDIYALGVILAEMLTGSPNASGLEKIPEKLVSVIDVCMRRDRSRRYASVAELSAALQDSITKTEKRSEKAKRKETADKQTRAEQTASTEPEFPVLQGSMRDRSRTLIAVHDDSLAIKRVTKDGEKVVKELGPVSSYSGVRIRVKNAFRWGGILIVLFFGLPFVYIAIGAVIWLATGGAPFSGLEVGDTDVIALGGFSGAMYAIPVLLYLMHLRLPKIGRIKGGWKRLSYANVVLETNNGDKVKLPMRRSDAEELQWKIG